VTLEPVSRKICRSYALSRNSDVLVIW